MNNEVSVVIVISKTFKFEKQSQGFLWENMTIAGSYKDRRLQSKERINVQFVMT